MDTILGRTAPVLVIEAPPRHGKSEQISKYLPAWFLGRYPRKRVILASYSVDFARSWGRKARDILFECGQQTFGVVPSRDQAAASDWEIDGHGGGMVSAGFEGQIVGRGADLFVIDDPIKNPTEAFSESFRQKQWEFWESTTSTRMEPGGCTIVIGTRWHEDDMIGRLKRQAEEGDAEVRLLTFPAIAEENDQLGRQPGEPLWPERWSIDALRKLERSKDVYWWQSLYQQRPGRHGRCEWPDEYFGEHIWVDFWPDAFERRVMAVDPSRGKGTKTGDFFAVVFVGLTGGLLYVDAFMRRSGSVSDIVGGAVDFAREHVPDAVMLEANAFQDLLAPEFDRQCSERQMSPLPINLIHNMEDKINVRIPRIGPYLAREKLRFRDTPECRQVVKQLEEFPLADHDDGPDALEMAIRLLGHVSASDEVMDERVMA